MTSSDERRSASAAAPFGVVDPPRIPGARYHDRDFYELEKEKLFGRAWQMACRLEEIPQAGDFAEYEICGRSVLLVRQPDGSVKAFENACRHRATQLALGAGRFGGGQIVCPFHGWRWNLDGSPSFLARYDEQDVAPECLAEDDLRLREPLCDTWGGCVWINLDVDARPLSEALAPAAEILDRVLVENVRVKWWKETILHCNWKIALEAFLEGMHVSITHPQVRSAGDEFRDRLTYESFENGHGTFSGGYADMPADYFINLARVVWEGQDAQTLEREVRLFEGLRSKVGSGEGFLATAVDAYYEYAAGAGIEMPDRSALDIWGGEVFLFPNTIMYPQYANCMVLRSRPHDDSAEWCRFEIWSLMTYPEGAEPRERPVCERYEQDDAEHFLLVPRQDFGNVERQQRGLHTPGFDASHLYPNNERNIANLHQEIDRYLAS